MKTIPLTKGYFTKVDDDDYKKFAIYRWYADASRLSEIRAVRSVNMGGKKIKRIILSREIMNAPKELKVDHINHNTLDNRKCNLRVCTQEENCRNRTKMTNSKSKYKGVGWNTEMNKWIAKIVSKGNRIHLGVFADEWEAALAYNEAAKKYYGEFAYLNKKHG
jgi:hypothetical protein